MVALSEPANESLPVPNQAARSRLMDGGSFEAAAATVLGQMQHAFRAFLDGIPGGVKRAADLQRAFDLDSKLAGQVYKVAHADNPAVACVNVPPRVSLERMLRAAAHRQIPAPLIAAAQDAYERYERLVAAEGGSREQVEVMLGSLLPEERARQQLASRAAMFKAMSQIRGIVADTAFQGTFYKPSADRKSIDRATLLGFQGLRRMRSDVRIRLSFGGTNQYGVDNPVKTLAGIPIDGLEGSFLPQFSSSPVPKFTVSKAADGKTYYYVDGDTVGMRSAVDLAMADQREGTLPLYSPPGPKRKSGGVALNITKPVRRTTLDVFLHRDVCPGSLPRLEVYDGFQHLDGPLDPEHKLDTPHHVTPILGGVTCARLPHLPQYGQMLEHVTSTLGWDPADFRGYRLDIEYPIYGTRYCVWFELPFEGESPKI